MLSTRDIFISAYRGFLPPLWSNGVVPFLPLFFSFCIYEDTLKECGLVFIWWQEWEMSRKSGQRVRKSDTGRLRDPERPGKENRAAWGSRADLCVQPPPLLDSEVCKPELGCRGFGKLTSPRPPSVWSLAHQGLVNPSPAVADTALSFWVLASPSASAA